MHEFFLSENVKKNFSQRLHDFVNRSFLTQCSLAGVIHAGMSRGEQLENISQTLGICQRTARRWLAGTSDAHPSAIRLLFTLYGGVPLGDAWAGWQFNGGYMVSPHGYAISPDIDIQVHHLKNEISVLRGKLTEPKQTTSSSATAVRLAIKSLMRAFNVDKADI